MNILNSLPTEILHLIGERASERQRWKLSQLNQRCRDIFYPKDFSERVQAQLILHAGKCVRKLIRCFTFCLWPSPQQYRTLKDVLVSFFRQEDFKDFLGSWRDYCQSVKARIEKNTPERDHSLQEKQIIVFGEDLGRAEREYIEYLHRYHYRFPDPSQPLRMSISEFRSLFQALSRLDSPLDILTSRECLSLAHGIDFDKLEVFYPLRPQCYLNDCREIIWSYIDYVFVRQWELEIDRK
jgi:hypothetical protein